MDSQSGSQRSTVISTMLVLMSGSVFLFFLFLVCGGLWVYVVLVVAGMALFMALQYVLWGRSMSAAIAKETAAADESDGATEIPDRAEAGQWTPEERSWYQRF